MGTHAAKKSVGLHNQASTRAEHQSEKKINGVQSDTVRNNGGVEAKSVRLH